jgi:hypothetical protein
MAEYRSYGFTGMLTKPYSIQKMSALLEECLKQNNSR